MRRLSLPFAAALAATLVAVPVAAQQPAADPQASIARSLERIALALERIERAQGFQIWLARAEVAAVGQRELERQFERARSRVESIEEEQVQIGMLLNQMEEELRRNPELSSDDADAQVRQLEQRADLLRDSLRDAEARRSELEARLIAAERQVQDLLADIDRQLRAP